MKPEEPAWIQQFRGLDDDSKYMIVQLGVETLLRVWTFETAGFATLKGAMHYVDKDTNVILDIMLHALNGSKQHKDHWHAIVRDIRFRKPAMALHHINGLNNPFLSGKEPLHEG
jgi:hypothetical protein